MTVTQVKDLMNEVTKEVLGEENIVNENLSNVVDIGTQIFNSSSVDSYVKSLVNHIGRGIFVNRVDGRLGVRLSVGKNHGRSARRNR